MRANSIDRRRRDRAFTNDRARGFRRVPVSDAHGVSATLPTVGEIDRDLEAKALALPSRDRARLAQRLLASLEGEADPNAEAHWLEEAERRLDAFEAGAVEPIPAEEAIRRSRSTLR